MSQISVLLSINLLIFSIILGQSHQDYVSVLKTDRYILIGQSNGYLLGTDLFSCSDDEPLIRDYFKQIWYGDQYQLSEQYPGDFNLAPVISIGVTSNPKSQSIQTRMNASSIRNISTFCGAISAYRNEITTDPDFYSSSLNFNLLLGDVISTSVSAENYPVAPISKIRQTWPENIYSLSYWPESYHQNISEHAYSATLLSLTDTENDGTDQPLAIKFLQLAYAYNNPLLKDAAFFELLFINESAHDYFDVYVGINSTMDVGANSVTSASNSVENGVVDDFEILSYSGYHAVAYGGPILDSAQVGLVYSFAERNQGELIPLSGLSSILDSYWMYIDKYVDPDEYATEEESRLAREFALSRSDTFYHAIMSNDTSLLTGYELGKFEDLYGVIPEDFRFLPTASLYTSVSADLASFGPFEMSAGDTIRIPYALIFSKNAEDQSRKARSAFNFIVSGFNTDFAPPPPHVSCQATPEGIVVKWDTSSELPVDPITGYHDFEGYRVYRSSSPPYLGEWEGPLFEVDEINGVFGVTDYNPDINLGNETGLVYTFTDTTVLSGMTYWYYLEAYDRGVDPNNSELNPDGYIMVPSLASSVPQSTADAWVDSATFSQLPTNIRAPNLKFSRTRENIGNGIIQLENLSNSTLGDHHYHVELSDTSGEMTANIFSVQNDTLLIDSQVTDGKPGPWIDGWRMTINNFSEINEWPDSTRWLSGESNWEIYSEPYRRVSGERAGDFLMIFAEDTLLSSGKTGPWRVFNRRTGLQLDWNIFQNSFDDTTDEMINSWTDGDDLIIFDGGPAWITRLSSNPQVGLDSNGDTLYIDFAPQLGDTLLLATQRPWHSGESFRVETQAIVENISGDSGLASEVSVFPNPYIITSSWQDTREGVAFIGLEYGCRVRVFTQTGAIVWEYEHLNTLSDIAYWNLTNQQGMDVAYGLYLWHVETSGNKTQSGKLVVIR